MNIRICEWYEPLGGRYRDARVVRVTHLTGSSRPKKCRCRRRGGRHGWHESLQHTVDLRFGRRSPMCDLNLAKVVPVLAQISTGQHFFKKMYGTWGTPVQPPTETEPRRSLVHVDRVGRISGYQNTTQTAPRLDWLNLCQS